VRDDAGDVAALLESIDLFPAHLIGHSYGGAVAFRLALDRPELVRSVVVHEPPFLGLLPEDAAGGGDAALARAEIRRLQARVRTGDLEGSVREFVDRFLPDPDAWGRLDPTARERLARNAERWAEEFDDPETTSPSRNEFAGLDLPVLVTTGERSLPLFHRIEAELVGSLRNASARSLPGAGHVPHLTHPEMYVGVLASFLLERNVPPT
jgi:pimeloyl-ACP methyl ester carboxylesterase